MIETLYEKALEAGSQMKVGDREEITLAYQPTHTEALTAMLALVRATGYCFKMTLKRKSFVIEGIEEEKEEL